jgi:hypothetical protein
MGRSHDCTLPGDDEVRCCASLPGGGLTCWGAPADATDDGSCSIAVGDGVWCKGRSAPGDGATVVVANGAHAVGR